jgi:hypothetical protein
MKDHKKAKELERAVAAMIFDQKSGKMKKEKVSNPVRENEVDDMAKNLKGGYREGEYEIPRSIKEQENFEQRDEISSSISRGPALNAARRLNDRKPNDSNEEKHRNEQEQNTSSSATAATLPTAVETAHSSIAPQSEIDSSLVMKYLGEQSKIESKFIVSVFDFGGQSVFNVIHPFFLTRFGVYVITFNMEWLASSADPVIREECIRYMSFWLNSVIIHTQNEKGEIAPVVFVGTRKDLITSPAEHQAISTYLYNIFSNSLAWSFVIENNGAEGQFGKADLCFFPVNNTIGNQDPTVQKLLQLIEESIDQSSYVHVERPLSWFQVLDVFKSKNVPYMEYNEVESIILSCNIPKDRVPSLLRFLHEMGILMWHDEDTLRDIIVFDPIEYFVKPATIIICKHVPNQSDGIYHSTEIHRKVKKMFPKEFREMVQHGIVSELLLTALLGEFSENYKYVKQLMLKYGLLVPLILSKSEEYHNNNTTIETPKNNNDTDEEKIYLAPALLPEKDDQLVKELCSSSPSSSSSSSSSNCFSFIFTPSNDLSQMSTLTLDDCNKLGFLPSGLFEKLISKAIGWSMTTSNFISRGNLYNCFKNCAELAFGSQRFLLTVDYSHNLITIHVLDGNNPLSIHDRLRDQINGIISECLKSLKFLSLLKYQQPLPKASVQSSLLFIRLNQIYSLVEAKSALSISIAGGRNLLSSTEALQLYGPWLTDFLPYKEFDLFISYRWGRYDSNFTKALFDRLSLHSVDHTMRSIHTFLDVKRLQTGENFQRTIANALSKSLIIVPIVSSDALERMMTLKPTDEDNLLFEWICGLELMKHRQQEEEASSSSRLMKFMPIFFGTRIDENSMKNFFQEDLLSKLPNTAPTACLEVAKNVLLEVGVTMSAAMRNATVKEIVTEVTKYLFLCAWQPKNAHQLTLQAANEITTSINECLQLEQEQHHQQSQSESQLPSHDATTTVSLVVNEKSSEKLSLSSPVAVVATPSPAIQSAGVSLLTLKDMLKNALGIESNNIQEVLKEALSNLSEEEQAECNAIKLSRDKAYKIAEFIGLV